MNTSHVKYSPSPADLSMLNKGEEYTEIWQGLPQLAFEPVESGGSVAQRYSASGHYIWVPARTYSAIKADPTVLLWASCAKKGSKTHVTWVERANGEVFGSSLESAVQTAIKLNLPTLNAAAARKREDEARRAFAGTVKPKMKGASSRLGR